MPYFPSGRIGFQFVDELSLQREILFEKNDSPAAEKWVGISFEKKMN